MRPGFYREGEKNKMYNIYDAPFVREMCEAAGNMYRLGWDERNGGNISCRLEESSVIQYLNPENILRAAPLGFQAKEVAGQYYIVTGSGKYFKNVPACPQNNLGIIRISGDGSQYEILWGFEDGGRPTSELPTHLMNHAARQKVDPEHRVVMHCHPSNILSMTFVHELDERTFTRTLWKMSTECIIVFPEGVSILPWMVCGTNEIGEATAVKIQDTRVVLWAAHGIFGAGRDLDEAFGLIETVEKAAEIYMKIGSRPVLQSITDAQLGTLAEAFRVTPRAGYLDL